MSSFKRHRCDQPVKQPYESNDKPAKREKPDNSTILSKSNDSDRVQSIPEAVFTVHVLPYLALDDMLQLSFSLVDREWCKWTKDRFIERSTKCQLSMAYDGAVYHVRMITSDDDGWTEDHAYRSKGKLVYVFDIQCGEREFLLNSNAYDAESDIKWSLNEISNRDRMGSIAVEDSPIEERRDFKLSWRDDRVRLAFKVDCHDDDDSDVEVEMIDLSFHSLRLTFLHMAELWADALDRMRWIQLTVLKSDKQRQDWRDLMLYLREHDIRLKRMRQEEMKGLAELCVANQSRQWMNYCDSVMNACPDVPISFWNQPSLSVTSKHDARVHFVDVNLSDPRTVSDSQ